jgi:uncharacterized BrkB/YihY/UPF0761 family membrane protein
MRRGIDETRTRTGTRTGTGTTTKTTSRRNRVRSGARNAASRAIAKAGTTAGAQAARLRRNRHTGRALSAYDRYYALAIHDSGSAIVYYATIALFPVLILAYLALAWLARHHPAKFKNADQNLANSLGIPVDKVGSLFNAQAHALLTATTAVVGSIGVVYFAWAWMDTYGRALRKIWETDNNPVLWRRIVRDSLAALVSIPLMFLAFAASGMGVTGVTRSFNRHGLSWHLLVGASGVLVVIAAAVALFTLVCQQTFRRLGGAPAGRHLWLASMVAGLLLAGMSIGAQVLLRQTIENPYGIVMNILGLMLWVSIAVRIVLSMALWAAGDPAARSPGKSADPDENSLLTAS